MLANLAYNKTKKRGLREFPASLSDQDLDIAAVPRRRAAILILTTQAGPLRITSAHHQTVFEPPFMTSIGPLRTAIPVRLNES